MYHVIGLKQTRSIKNVTLKEAKKNLGRLDPLGRVVNKGILRPTTVCELN